MSKELLYSAQDILARVTKTPVVANGLSDAEKIERIEKSMRDILSALGMDLSNDSLRESPRRIAKMYVNELFKGLRDENFPKITTIDNDMGYDQMIVVRDASVLSTCEHHFVAIHGAATIAYIPSRKVIGLSKLNRIADYFSRRPQVQERLTKQIADCLEYVLETDNVAVHINAKHYCVISRGVQDSHSTTVTSDLRGDFKRRSETRLEFLKHCTTKSLGLEV
jgi:GTP cyclohydrolase I